MIETSTETLAERLAAGWQSGIAFAELPHALIPTSAEAAYAAQAQLLIARGTSIGAWKVGAKGPDAPIQGSPLPQSGLHFHGATLPQRAFRPLGLELEIAFCFGRAFAARAQAYDAAEVLGGIAYMAAAVEIVTSRFHEWPAVDRFAQLADLQNHGALVMGEVVAYRADFPFVAPSLSFTVNSRSVVDGTPANPAGDPRRLLPWLVNHATQRGMTLPSGTLVTTGSYTGMHFPDTATGPNAVLGRIDGLPPVGFTLA